MSGLALGIVLVAAFLHAGWNYLSKKSKRKIVFIWWFLLIAAILYFPMFLYFWSRTNISNTGWIYIAVTGVLHALYFWFMGGAYERGDLSLVYPLSRGSGPLFVPFLAVFLIHEKLSLLGAIGIALIIFGIYVLHLQSFSRQSFFVPFKAMGSSASLWALCTGGTIAAGFFGSLYLPDGPFCVSNEQGQLCGCCPRGKYLLFGPLWDNLVRGETCKTEIGRISLYFLGRNFDWPKPVTTATIITFCYKRYDNY